VAEQVLAHDHHGQAGGADVFLRARIDQPNLAHIDGRDRMLDDMSATSGTPPVSGT
jgi:hypothetical protein